MLAPNEAYAALRCAEGIGAALARAGRLLIAPEAEMRRSALASAAAVHRGEATLH